MAISRPIGKNSKLATFKKETTYGTYVAPSQDIHFTSEALKYTVKTVEDPSNVGEAFTSDLINVGYDVAGAVETVFHPYFAGETFYFTLGKSDSPTSPFSAVVIIWYTGTDNYQRMRLVATDLIAETSPDNITWTGDANFGAAGTLDLTGVGVDTIAELTSTIAGYTGYDCDYRGYGATLTSKIPAFANTTLRENDVSKNGLPLFAVDTSTVAKTHKIYADNSSTASLPSFSTIVDRGFGTAKNFGYSGCKISSLSLKMNPKDLMTASINIVAKDEYSDKTYGASTVQGTKAFITNNAMVWINRLKTSEIKEFTLEITNNLYKDEAIDVDTFNAQDRQGAMVKISGTANLTVTSSTDRVTSELQDALKADSPVEVLIYCEGTDYADSAVNSKYAFFIRIPKVKLSEATTTVTGADRLTLPFSGTAVKDQFSRNHIDIWCVNKITSAY